jgi:hypothetical protein
MIESPYLKSREIRVTTHRSILSPAVAVQIFPLSNRMIRISLINPSPPLGK